jgi:hypothetical protein
MYPGMGSIIEKFWSNVETLMESLSISIGGDSDFGRP